MMSFGKGMPKYFDWKNMIFKVHADGLELCHVVGLLITTNS